MEIKLTVITLFFSIIHGKEIISREKRNVLFPSGSAMGIYLALALPVDLPQYEISMSFNYEANYILPSNATELALGPYHTEIRKARAVTRKKLYTYIEEIMLHRGFFGKPCLLRTICETQMNPIYGHNGLVGDIIHLMFT
ncbi:conserved hypothetical protein [Pediculus humanus corporis]|uniref:Uncharacterized protein n=1 Tax=Pediculus humanus subsp. corporis TaxID=121224 RepID=E0VJI4_PEDHC|nr:uncharacterized protein Phum_PHUM245550 [Pediculus humanus corporis]EEB13540.1 conserved hypothetical protein [Pediculus humanus corporis]